MATTTGSIVKDYSQVDRMTFSVENWPSGYYATLGFVITFCTVFLMGDAFAAGDVFDELALRAGNLGNNLQKVGYIIAGLGLIAFAVAAMFSKISWKTFAYIAMSTFFLTAMTAAIAWVKAPPGEIANISNFSSSGTTEFVSGIMDKLSSGH